MLHGGPVLILVWGLAGLSQNPQIYAQYYGQKSVFVFLQSEDRLVRGKILPNMGNVRGQKF